METKLIGIDEWRKRESQLKPLNLAQNYPILKIFIIAFIRIATVLLPIYCGLLLVMAWKITNCLMQST
jgi:hypothetical protein